MTWAAIGAAAVAAVGSVVASKQASKKSASGSQTTEFTPAPRTSEAQDLWDMFMGKIKGGQPGYWTDPVYKDVPAEPTSAEQTRTPIYAKTDPTEYPQIVGYYDAPQPSATRVLVKPSEFVATGPKTPGLSDVLTGQEKYLAPLVKQYTGDIGDLMTNKGIGQGLLDRISVSLGGSSPVSFLQKRNLAAMGTLSDLAGKKLAAQASYMPGWSQLKELEFLNPIIQSLEGMRYQTPSSTSSGSLTSSPSLMQSIGSGINIGNAIMDLINKNMPKTTTTAPNTNLPVTDWGEYTEY